MDSLDSRPPILISDNEKQQLHKIARAAFNRMPDVAEELQFELERAEVSGIAVPRSLLQQIVAFYTKSADRPNGASLDDTFEMPAQIRQIDVLASHAVVIQ